MVEQGARDTQRPHPVGAARPGEREIYLGLFRDKRPADESRLHRGDRFTENGVPLQDRDYRQQEAGGLDRGGGDA